jgi:hypothetical protein
VTGPLVRLRRAVRQPRLWQCHLWLRAGDVERHAMVGPVPARDAQEANQTVLAELLAGRRLPAGWRVRCRSTWW